VPQIEVKFDIDVNGIVNVAAKDMGTGKEQSMTITASTNLNDKEIEKMVKEAEQYAAEDSKRKEEVETRNQADSMVYQAEKTIKDFKDKADPAAVEKLQKALDELKEALKGQSIDEIKAKSEAMTGPLYELSAAMYQQTQQQAGAGEAGPGGPNTAREPKENVVDADFEVKEDK